VLRIRYNALLPFSERLLARGGMPADDAALVARLLVKADLRGYPGHGVTRIAPYLSWIKDGIIDITATPRIERDGKLSAVIDGRHYIGQALAVRGMELAIKKAQDHGAGFVAIRRASHSGRLADYMEMAADAGMIGMGAVSVGSAVTTTHGGMKPVTGTNPMAFGIPARGRRHIILDFATASMSMGEIQKRVARTEPVPDGVMLDGRGFRTNDFSAFRGPPRGVLLPFGGHKGAGMALITDILGGILTGNGPGRNWWKKGGHGVNGMFLQAFAVEEFQSLESFYDQIDEFIVALKATPRAPGFDEILLPGEKSRRTEAAQLQEGVAVDAETWGELVNLAAELNIAPVPQANSTALL
jgi:LDH2 family malate/lactate/ureidoglycolate dehydrogenase